MLLAVRNLGSKVRRPIWSMPYYGFHTPILHGKRVKIFSIFKTFISIFFLYYSLILFSLSLFLPFFVPFHFSYFLSFYLHLFISYISLSIFIFMFPAWTLLCTWDVNSVIWNNSLVKHGNNTISVTWHYSSVIMDWTPNSQSTLGMSKFMK